MRVRTYFDRENLPPHFEWMVAPFRVVAEYVERADVDPLGRVSVKGVDFDACREAFEAARDTVEADVGRQKLREVEDGWVAEREAVLRLLLDSMYCAIRAHLRDR